MSRMSHVIAALAPVVALSRLASWLWIALYARPHYGASPHVCYRILPFYGCNYFALSELARR